MPENRTERFHFIDLMEFLAMLFVLIVHAIIFPFDFLKEPSGEVYLNYILKGILSTCSPIFFFCNGFLLFGSTLHLKKHLCKMVKLTAFTFIGGALILIPLMGMAHEPINFKNYTDALWNFRQGLINHLWFIGALICIYVFFPLLKETFDHNKKAFIWFTIITACLTFGNVLLEALDTVFLDIRGKADHVVTYNFFNMFNPYREIFGYTFVYFCVGGIVRWMLPQINALREKMGWKLNAAAAGILLVSTVLLGIWGIYASRIQGTVWDNVWNGYDTVFTFINVLAIGVLCMNYKAEHRWSRFIQLVSQNTFGIFIYHLVFSRILRIPIQNLPFMQNPLANIAFALLVMMITLAVILAAKAAGKSIQSFFSKKLLHR